MAAIRTQRHEPDALGGRLRDHVHVLTRRRWAGLVTTVVALIVVGVATLVPVTPSPEQHSAWCVTCGSLWLADALVNVVLFVPAGVGLGLLGRRIPPAVAALALVSVTIEVFQAWGVVGRDSSLRDVITNALGGAIGVALVRHWRTWIFPDARRASQLAVAAAVSWASTLGMTSVLAHPSVLPGPYWGQRGDDRFGASVVRVAVNDVPIPLGPLSKPRPVLAALNSRDARIDVAISPASPPEGIGPIARLSNPHTEAFRFGRRGADVIFGVRLRSADARLRSPAVRLRAALSDGARASNVVNAITPDTIHLRGSVSSGILRLERLAPAGTSRSLTLSPTVGWAFLTPIGITTRVAPWVLSGLWVVVLCFPIGYWTASAQPSGARWWIPALVAGIVVGALTLPPLVAATPWPRWWDSCFVVAGLLGGVLAATLLGSRPSRVTRRAPDPTAASTRR